MKTRARGRERGARTGPTDAARKTPRAQRARGATASLATSPGTRERQGEGQCPWFVCVGISLSVSVSLSYPLSDFRSSFPLFPSPFPSFSLHSPSVSLPLSAFFPPCLFPRAQRRRGRHRSGNKEPEKLRVPKSCDGGDDGSVRRRGRQRRGRRCSRLLCLSRSLLPRGCYGCHSTYRPRIWGIRAGHGCSGVHGVSAVPGQ